MFLVRYSKVGDHFLIFLLKLRGSVTTPALQLRIEPEMLPHTEPDSLVLMRGKFYLLAGDWSQLLLLDGVEDDCDWNHYRFLFSQSVNDLTQ